MVMVMMVVVVLVVVMVVMVLAMMAMLLPRVRGCRRCGGRCCPRHKRRRLVIGDRGIGSAQATIRQHEALRPSFQHADSILPTALGGESSSFNGSSPPHRPTVFLRVAVPATRAPRPIENVRARPLPRPRHPPATPLAIQRRVSATAAVLRDELDGSARAAAHRRYPYIATGLRSVGEA